MGPSELSTLCNGEKGCFLDYRGILNWKRRVLSSHLQKEVRCPCLHGSPGWRGLGILMTSNNSGKPQFLSLGCVG